MRIFFSVGEPSGDLHGANLIAALRRERPAVECMGYGGPLMAEAGCQLHADLTVLAVMWLLRALLNIHRFVALAVRADRYFRHHRPDAVVLIDYPGFNWWIARRAKAHGIPVFYYTPPQIWAWARWRVHKMRRFVDHVLCSLPFEEAWLRGHGCNATFVGHPYFDEVTTRQLDGAFLAEQQSKPGRLVTILPGSRTQEVLQNLPAQLKAAGLIAQQVPDVRFAVACFKPQQSLMARTMVEQSGMAAEIFVRRTPELIELAECCLAVSGSVSLELLYHRKPTVILYTISRLAYFVQGWFRRVKYITLVNLLATERPLAPADIVPYDPSQPDADKIPFPEYLTCEDRSRQIAAHAIEWLTNEPRRQARIAQLDRMVEELAHGGASQRAAQYIVQTVAARPSPIPKPHFRPGMRVESSALDALPRRHTAATRA